MTLNVYEMLRKVLEKWRTRRRDFPSPDQAIVQASVDAALQRLLLEPGLDDLDTKSADTGVRTQPPG